MKTLFEKCRIFAAVIVIVIAMLLGSIADATTTNPSPASPGYIVLPIHISGQYTATAADIVSFKAPFPAEVVGCQLTARASGGTSPTLTITVQQASTTLCTAAITAGAVSEPTLSSTTIPDEAAVTIDFTIGGTSPTWNDMTVLLVLKRQ